MRIGFSLYTDLFREKDSWRRKKEWSLNFSSSEEILACLREEGVTSIELKLPFTISERDLVPSLAMLSRLGFEYTFHAPPGVDYPDQFEAFSGLLQQIARISEKEFGQSSFFVVHGLTHPRISKSNLLSLTKEFLLRTRDALAQTDFSLLVEVLREPVNNGKIRTGTSYHEVLDLIRHQDPEVVGICWDFGHSYAQAEHGIHSRIPPEDFLLRVKHTHIHDYKNDTTHIPLGNGGLPYQDYIQRLVSKGFNGIYNLELNPGRITDPENFKAYIIQSIRLIKLVLNRTKSISN